MLLGCIRYHSIYYSIYQIVGKIYQKCWVNSHLTLVRVCHLGNFQTVNNSQFY